VHDESTTFAREEGARLFLLPDGLPEAPASSVEPPDRERLSSIVAATWHRCPVTAWPHSILAAVGRFTSPALEAYFTAAVAERSGRA
jgi:hypothetical protein